MPGRLRALGVTLSLSLLASASVAQSREDTEELVVLGVRPGTLERDVSAFRDVLQTDDFLGEQQDLADLLGRQPGIHVRRFGGPGDASEVSIRGSSSAQVVVNVNGVPVNSALTGRTNLTRLCVPLIEEVGITRGGGGIGQSSGAIGGTVDLVTRAAGPHPEMRASFAGGAFETFEGSLFGSNRVGALGISLGYCGLDTEGDFQFARPRRRGPDGIPVQFTPAQTTRINNRSSQHAGSLGLGGEVGSGRLELFDFWSLAESGAPGIDCCQGPTAGQNPKATEQDFRNLVQLRWKGAPDDARGYAPSAMLYHRYEESRFRDPVQLAGGRVDSLTKLSTLGLLLDDRWHAAYWRTSQTLGVHLDATQDLLHATRRSSRSRTRLAGGLSLDWGFFDERLRITGAVRADWPGEFDLEWIPSAGLVWTPVDWLRIRANATRGYRPPSFDELYFPNQGFQRGNPRLQPEDAWQFDAGLALVADRLGPLSDIELSARYFQREIQNAIVWLRISSTTLAPINTGNATSKGVELSLDFALTRFLALAASHTEIDSTRDATDEPLPGTPERETSVRLRLGPEDVFKLVGELLYTGEILVDEGGGERLPARRVWNASAALNLAALPWPGRALDALWLFVAVDNIGDEAVRDDLAFPRPGRQASAGFEVHW